jgi:hypothetical protein
MAWHHIAVVFDRDGNATGYVDGTAEGARDISPINGSIANEGILSIGNSVGGGNEFYGKIDDVRIWNITLTQNQIQSTMHLRLTGNEPGLVGYWRFDEEPGTPIAHDSSPFGNDGTLFGDADFVEPGAPIAKPTVEPNILVYPTELVFGDVIVGKFEEQTLTVVNTGEQDLHVTDISSDNADVTVTPNSFSLAMGQSQQVFVRYSPQTEGPLSAILQIESNDPDAGIVEVVVIGQGVPYVNRALSLGGSGYVEIPHAESLNITDAITIEVWIKTSDNTGYFAQKLTGGWGWNTGYGLTTWGLTLGIGGPGTNYIQVPFKKNIFDNKWHHVVGTAQNNNSMRVYVNGILDNEKPFPYVLTTNSETLTFSGRVGWDMLIGFIDEVRIWNYARTKEEIRADMNQPIENPELLPNLVGYWNFDDGTAKDSSLYGNHGTPMGDAEIVPLYGSWPPVLRGDVSGDGTISAYDAALILQYTVGLRDSFPADMLASPDGISPVDYILSLPFLTANAGNRPDSRDFASLNIQVPIFINDATGLTAGGITLKYDPTVLKAVNVTSQTLFLNGAYNKANVDLHGEVRFAFATTQPMNGHGNLFTVEFEVLPNTTGKTSPLILDNVELSNSLSITKIDGSVTVLPSRSALLQNYPNPFNPETWIPFELANEAEVVLEIYNIKGELVRVLSIGHKSAGCYLSKEKAVFWNGKNQNGEAVANGLYFYTLKAGEFQATRKMILVK